MCIFTQNQIVQAPSQTPPKHQEGLVKEVVRMTCILNSNAQYSLDNFVVNVLFSVFTEWEESLIYLPFRSLKVNALFWGC